MLTQRIYNKQTTSTLKPIVILLISLSQPIIKGIIAPPEMAIIIRPDISFFLVEYFSTVIAYTKGKIFAIVNPMTKTNTQATIRDFTTNIEIKLINPRAVVQNKNLREESLVNIIAPAKVPSILPKK